MEYTVAVAADILYGLFTDQQLAYNG